MLWPTARSACDCVAQGRNNPVKIAAPPDAAAEETEGFQPPSRRPLPLRSRSGIRLAVGAGPTSVLSPSTGVISSVPRNEASRISSQLSQIAAPSGAISPHLGQRTDATL